MTNMTNMTNVPPNAMLPYRFRESSFRTYESIIQQAIAAYPNVITINPRLTYNLSPTTFACRFRDAMNSYFRNNWPSSTINRDLFDRVYSKITTSEVSNGGLIRIGDKAELRRPDGLAPTHYQPTVAETLPFLLDLDEAESRHDVLDVICKLASFRLLTQEVKVKGITDQEIQYFTSSYDCSIARNDSRDSSIAGVL